MDMRPTAKWFLIRLFLCTCTSWTQTSALPAADQSQIGYKVAADADQKQDATAQAISTSGLDACMSPFTRCPKPSSTSLPTYTHHVNDAATGIDESMAWTRKLREVEIMDKPPTSKPLIILTGMWRDKLQHVIDEMVKPYPGRFIVFTQIDWSRIDDPDFGPYDGASTG